MKHRWLLLGAASCLLVRPALANADDRIRIAVLPVVIHSAEDPSYLREGMADMLTSRLEQLEEFDVVLIDDPSKATTRVGPALGVAKDVEADYVLFGSFTRFGAGASLDMQCAATNPVADRPPLREIFVHSGSIADVIPDLDTLVGKVSRFVDTSFDPGAVFAERDAPPPQRISLADLARRLQALEQTVQAIESGAPEEDAVAAAPDAEVEGEQEVATSP